MLAPDVEGQDVVVGGWGLGGLVVGIDVDGLLLVVLAHLHLLHLHHVIALPVVNHVLA